MVMVALGQTAAVAALAPALGLTVQQIVQAAPHADHAGLGAPRGVGAGQAGGRRPDPAFARPTKRVGPVYPQDVAHALARRHGWHIAKDATGWHQVVASPSPEGIVETETIHDLLTCGALVICAGGGGVPVTADHDTGALTGADAVVDKDLTAALLAEELKADFLLILTDVPCVYTGYGTHDPQPVLDATPDDLRRGGFPAGSMGPKTEAAARFVERTGALAAIGALDAAYEIVHGRSGTLVRRDLTVG
ncbi:amino acid kinase family protein [Streptomyces galilaeus]|uniref:amino acid kinase family protein n=1 Tax=Streptomyces galilaeus TaxID=33899 RepID=UPI0038F7597B